MIVWQAQKGKLESIAFSADGRFLATATGGPKSVRLWDATSGKLARKLTERQLQSMRPVGGRERSRDRFAVAVRAAD